MTLGLALGKERKSKCPNGAKTVLSCALLMETLSMDYVC